MRMHSRLLYIAPAASADLRAEMPELLCASDITNDGGVEDLITDEIDWGVVKASIREAIAGI